MCASSSCANALTSLGFTLAGLIAATEDGQTNAEHAFPQSLALSSAVLVVWVWQSRGAALGLAVVLTVMQLWDSVVGIRIGDPMRYRGPLALALVTVWAAQRLWPEAAKR